MKRTLKEEIGQTIPDSRKKQKRYTNSADALGDTKRSDPLCLTSVVVDNILEHLDDRSLLTGRLACRSWNAEITSRNYLWKQRCQRKPVFHFNLSTTPLDDVFHQYVRFHHVYHRMMSGDAFQVDKHSETLDCFHGAREDNSLSQICGRRTFSEDLNDFFKEIFFFDDQLWVGQNTLLLLTGTCELVMADLKTLTVLWRQADVERIFYDHFCHHTIYAVTLTGDVKLFSLEGKCDLQIHTGGKLKGARFMFRHPRCHFIVVVLANDEVHLVDVDNKRVIKLQLAFPRIPEDGDAREEEEEEEGEEEVKDPRRAIGFMQDRIPEDGDAREEEEEEEGEEEVKDRIPEDGDAREEEEEEEEEEEVKDPSRAIGFMQDESLSRQQLAICLCKKYSVAVAIINTDGKILRQDSRTFSQLLSWNESDLFNKQDSHIIVRKYDWIEKYSIRCKPSGIQFNLLWTKLFPHRLLASHAQTLMCGDQFILGQEGRSLVLFRLSDAELVVSIPGFFRRRFNRRWNSCRLIDVSGESPELTARRIQILKARRMQTLASRRDLYVFLNNTSWLNGLSPATTKPDVPVLLYVSDADTDMKCLHWSADLWTGNDLQVQQLEQGKPKTGLGLHAKIEHWNIIQWPHRGKKAD